MEQETENMRAAAAYLIGEMAGSERDAFEERLFADPELSISVDGVEDDLIDEYLSGELSETEREKFERHFLISERRRGKLTAASVLQRHLFAAPDAAAGDITEPTQPIWDRLRSVMSVSAPAFAGAGIAVLILTAGYFLLLRQPNQVQEIAGPFGAQGSTAVPERRVLNEPETPLPGSAGAPPVRNSGTERPRGSIPAREALPEKSAAPNLDRRSPEARPSARVFAIALFPVTRSGANPEFLVPAGVETVRVKVTHNNEEPFVRYRVELRDSEGRTIWNREVANRPASTSLTISLPSAVLGGGSYELALLGVDKTGQYTETNFYNFSVERK